MRLRSLTVQAIGPFAGRHTVDFDALGTSGLFLLEGPTGAGKSTLIDAVVFALYGKVAGADASEERLRSAYAPDDVESVVDLVFETAAGVHRVRRTPAYQRAKRRGAGTTTAQASVKAWRLPADVDPAAGPDVLDTVGTLLGTRLDEVGAELQRVVGLDRTQFVQTIVLPQGEFARFLRANPEDRRGLLQKIFGTQVYEQVQKQLAQMRREADRAVEAARADLAEAVAHLLGACALPDDDAVRVRALLDDAVTGTQVADRVGTVVGSTTADLDRQADDEERASVAATAAWERARDADEGARATAALVERRAVLRTGLARLDADAEQHAADAGRLVAARAAAAVRPVLTGADDATTAHAAARKALAAAVDAAPADLLPPGEPGPGWRDPVETARSAAADDAARLERLVAVEARLDADRHEVRDLAAVLDDLRSEVALADAWLAGRPAARAALVDRLEAARATAAQAGERAARLESAERLVQDVEAHRAADAERTVAAAARDEAARAAHAAVRAEADLRSARVAGLAGELAAALTPGCACPVCGATEHPAPAAVRDDHVTDEQVDAAQAVREAAERVLAEAGARHAALVERVAGLAARTGGQDSVAVVAARDAARAALADAEQADATATDLAAQTEAFDAATKARHVLRDEVDAQHRTAELALVARREQLDRAEAEVVEGRDGYPTVAARHAVLDARASLAAALLEALADERAAAEHAAARTAELRSALAEHGFASADEARAAWCAPDALAALERRVQDVAAERARLTGGLAEASLAALAEDVAVDLDATGAAERAARAAADDLAGRARVARERALAASTAAARVLAAARSLDVHAALAAPVARMAALAAGTGGDNARALSLPTYVLARRFEDVVAAANDRLRVMSDGRYELVRSDAKEDVRTRTTGLSMRVVDHRTEQERDPRTLSGGETFYVSLCLALGMADVVTAEAGGIELGTLFVDEGFGALDPHVLDQVLVELGRLRAGGRVVGVVSHVEALKQAIADRVEVRPTRQGPSTLRVLAG